MSVGTGWTQPWGSLGAELRLPGGKPEPGSTGDVEAGSDPFRRTRAVPRAGTAAGEERTGGCTKAHPWHTRNPSSRSQEPSASCGAVSCSADGGTTMARWPGWQSSHRGYSPSSTQ